MKDRFRNEADDWRPDGQKINSPKNLETIRKCLEVEEHVAVIVEHWFYRGSCAPDRLLFDDYEELIGYLDNKASAGDMINIWSFDSCCHDDNMLVHGKCPDKDGLAPRRGAY